ncbi:MAG: tRNA pseudouridine(38-40) synthase TruA [Cyclobacteriaceae bacterium]
MRYFLDIAYLGTDYHGWQIQNNASSVQAEINKALSTILRENLECLGSGRTDTGVHATKQIAHFDLDQPIDTNRLVYKMNSFLPKSIAINSCVRVKDEAHARFDAESRSYQYHLHAKKDPFKQGGSYFFTASLHLESIREACDLILSWKNFEAFSKVQTEVNHFNCDIQSIQWEEANSSHIFHVSANRFLRGMVRAMVGTLLQVGQGEMTVPQLKEVLESGDRRAAGRSVPAEGLYLTAVDYPDHIYTN